MWNAIIEIIITIICSKRLNKWVLRRQRRKTTSLNLNFKALVYTIDYLISLGHVQTSPNWMLLTLFQIHDTPERSPTNILLYSCSTFAQSTYNVANSSFY